MANDSPDTKTLSRTAYQRLKTELDELTIDRRREVAERLQRARELGDLSENAEYHSAKDDQAMMEARIRQIEHLLKTATVIDGPVTTEAAVVGTVVSLRPKDDPGAGPERYLLAASKEERAKDAQTLTTSSPLGRAIQGAKIGDVVQYSAPGGTFSYEIVAIEPYDGIA